MPRRDRVAGRRRRRTRGRGRCPPPPLRRSGWGGRTRSPACRARAPRACSWPSCTRTCRCGSRRPAGRPRWRRRPSAWLRWARGSRCRANTRAGPSAGPLPCAVSIMLSCTSPRMPCWGPKSVVRLDAGMGVQEVGRVAQRVVHRGLVAHERRRARRGAGRGVRRGAARGRAGRGPAAASAAPTSRLVSPGSLASLLPRPADRAGSDQPTRGRCRWAIDQRLREFRSSGRGPEARDLSRVVPLMLLQEPERVGDAHPPRERMPEHRAAEQLRRERVEERGPLRADAVPTCGRLGQADRMRAGRRWPAEPSGAPESAAPPRRPSCAPSSSVRRRESPTAPASSSAGRRASLPRPA